MITSLFNCNCLFLKFRYIYRLTMQFRFGYIFLSFYHIFSHSKAVLRFLIINPERVTTQTFSFNHGIFSYLTITFLRIPRPCKGSYKP